MEYKKPLLPIFSPISLFPFPPLFFGNKRIWLCTSWAAHILIHKWICAAAMPILHSFIDQLHMQEEPIKITCNVFIYKESNFIRMCGYLLGISNAETKTLFPPFAQSLFYYGLSISHQREFCAISVFCIPAIYSTLVSFELATLFLTDASFEIHQ